MVISGSLGRVLRVASIVVFAAQIALARSGEKEVVVGLSWGDQIAFAGTSDRFGKTPLLTAESLRTVFRECKRAGVDTILFRVDVLRMAHDFNWPDPRTVYKNVPAKILDAEIKQWTGAFEGLKGNLLKPIVDIAHEEGLKIYASNTTFDEGMPLNEVMVEKGQAFGGGDAEGKRWITQTDIPSDMVSRFVEAHPEYVTVDRSQKKHNWGTLEFAYPQAREYAVGYNRWFLENYPFDGIYIDFRNEYSHPEFADEFGFAPPIVEEYQKRYGVNILREEFDLEKWRRLCGEYLTQYIRDLHSMTQAHGKPLMVAVPQGNYIGLPNGNMYIDWQAWVKEHIVEGLAIGIYTGSFIFPDRIGYGYLTDMEFGIGLPNLFRDLQNNYWPECAKYNVKLYVHAGRSRIRLADAAKTPVDGLHLWLHDVYPIDKNIFSPE